MTRRTILLAMVTHSMLAGCRAAPTAAPAPRETVRCAVIGGMMMTGFFPAVARRFEQESGYRVEVVATGNKEAITPSMQRGEVDLITMHASDAMANLVADGYALDAQPWAKNELVIIGPPEDPAGVRGLADAAVALRRIVAAHATLIVPHSMGAQEVLRTVARAAEVTLDETTAPHAPEGAAISRYAAERHAYTVVGRIPFKHGKIPPAGLVVAVEGDPRLRRPYLVAVANPQRFPGARLAAARALSEYLRSPATQRWMATFTLDHDDRIPFVPLSE